MSNSFYQEFDTQTQPGNRPHDYRTPFQVDRDRIIYSSAFRRLQSKTQVFLSGEYDFYRTRLTHSIEVAQIGRSICHYLQARKDGPLHEGFHVDADLVEAICLAHDLGHPPFGHAGERTLHQLMRQHGGFEGNAQTLRLLTEIIYANEESGAYGMLPTRAFLDGVLKYKTLRREAPEAENHFIYDDQEHHRTFAFGGTEPPPELAPGPPLNGFRSLECQIMDWADDTAYSLNDIIDGVRAGFLTFEKIEKWAERSSQPETTAEWMHDLQEAVRRGSLEAVFSRKIGACIRACSVQPWQNALSGRTNRYAFRLVVAEDVQREIAYYKQMAFDIIFCSSQLHQTEHKGGQILGQLFAAFRENYVEPVRHPGRILPALVENLVARESTTAGKLRRVCDHIAGMTDGLARRTWKRLFDPDFASIVDLG